MAAIMGLRHRLAPARGMEREERALFSRESDK